jgi:predicted membrane-bound spermidine synthase
LADASNGDSVVSQGGPRVTKLSLSGVAFLLVFFASGFAALLYQIIWQRLLTFFGGADVYSVTIIVSAFMGGLGFGSLAGGYLADRLSGRGRLFAFAACELAVALFAAFSTEIYYDLLYIRLGAWDVPRAGLAAIIFAVTLWPTFFMGMSLPLITTALTRDARHPARWVPLLYGWNTLGAACGSLVASFVLFRLFDFTSGVRLGAVISAGCALGAVIAVPFVPTREPDPADISNSDGGAGETAGRQTVASRSFGLGTWVAIYALSGFVALSLEIIWFRVLGVLVKSNSFTFGHLLGVYLSGVAIGSLAGNTRRARAAEPTRAFFLLQGAIPLVAAIALVLLVMAVDRVTLLAPLWEYLREYEPFRREDILSRPRLAFVLYIVLPVWLIGLPTVMMGLSFGHLQRAVQTDLTALGRRVGWLQTANIAGSMIGAMLTGLVLLGSLGTSGAMRLVVACGAVFFLLYARSVPARRWQAALAVLAIGVAASMIPSGLTLWARLHGTLPIEVVQSEDGSGLSVLKTPVGGSQTTVYANGLGQSSLPFGGIHTALGACPALLHPNPVSIAVIGLGSGDTAFSAGGRPETRTIDSIEIIAPELDTLQQLDRWRHYPGLRSLLNDGRVHHWFTDGRALLRKSGRRYDIIEADALRPTSAYAGNLFSLEYFELLRAHLNPGGVAITWIPTPRVVDSFIKAFPYVLVFERLAAGSDTPIPFDRSAIIRRMQDPFTSDYYSRGGVALDLAVAQCLEKPPAAYGPDFDRTKLVDVNRDLFPKDEFVIPRDVSPE